MYLLLIFLLFILLIFGASVARGVIGRSSSTSSAYSDEAADANDRLARGSFPDELAEPPELTAVSVANTRDDTDEDVLVPVVATRFDGEGEPAQGVVWETVGTVLNAITPVFEPLQLSHYDFQFAYPTPEGGVGYRRIAVTPTLVDRFARDPSYGPTALREGVAAGDDGDGTPPVNWRPLYAEAGPDNSDDAPTPMPETNGAGVVGDLGGGAGGGGGGGVS